MEKKLIKEENGIRYFNNGDWIDLSELPRKIGIGVNKNKFVIDWEKVKDNKCNFLYDGNKHILKILKCKKEINKENNRYKYFLTIEFNDKQYVVDKKQIVQMQFAKVFDKITSDFRFNIGDILCDEKRNMTIIDKEYREVKKKNCIYNEKYYKCHCNICGADLWIVESTLLKSIGCGCCANKICVKGINDIATTHPHLIKYFVNIEDAYTHTIGSSKKVLTKCPTCGFEKIDTINLILQRGFICPYCSDNLSVPEKIVSNFLKQLNTNFIHQLSSSTFDWCSRYRYDFYLKYKNIIIEAHGNQHYKRVFEAIGGRTLEEEQENDRIKKELALKNGIKYYVELDCRESNINYIKNSIMNSELPNLLNFKEEDIDWNECNENSFKSYIPLSWEYYDANKNIMFLNDMANKFNVGTNTFRNWLKKGTDIGKCTYKSRNGRTYEEDGVGVKFCENRNRWEASLYLNGKDFHKSFLTKEEAIQQRLEWEKEREELYAKQNQSN